MGTDAQIPWPGPRPYDEEHWTLFFGRERVVEEIRQKLVTQRLAVILGGSGSGKTSLIRAGLAPLLRNRRYHPTSRANEGPVLVFRGWGTTTHDTAQNLMEQQLNDAIGAIDRWHGLHREQTRAKEDAEHLKAVLEASKGQDILLTIEALANAVEALPVPHQPIGSAHSAPLVLIFDQLEELLRSKDRRSERETGRVGEEMLTLISDLFARARPLKILLSMREEYLYALRPLDLTVANMADKKVFLEPITSREARELVSRVAELPDVIGVDDDVLDELIPDPPADADPSADLLRLQAVLYALASHARDRDAERVDREVCRTYLAERGLSTGVTEEAVFQRAVEEWIESAIEGTAGSDDGRAGSVEMTASIRTSTGFAAKDVDDQVRRTAVRIAPHLSSSDYKVPQEQNNLLQRALGPIIEVLAPKLVKSLEQLTIDTDSACLKWGAADNAPELEHADLGFLSGPSRLNGWSARKTGDVIAACYLLTIKRFEERNILRRAYSARNDIICELVHDQMGPMLVRWAQSRHGAWQDCVSSLVALSAGPPITVVNDLVKDSQFYCLTWSGCTIQPRRAERLVFESTKFDRCELRGIVFDKCTFRGVEFSQCGLNGAIFRSCIFESDTDGARSLLISNDVENKLDCLLFLDCTMNNVEFRNSIVRQLSIVASDLQGDILFENCAVAQLYASKLKDKGREGAKIKILASSRVWYCSTDIDSFHRLDIRDARDGANTAAEPRNFVPEKPTTSQS
jgi:hypothetical protein